MSSPQYFKNVPNIKYATQINKAGLGTYVEMKDFFRLMRIRDDIFREDTLYYEYVVDNGERPERISFNEYGDERFYWMILQVNDITDFWSQWPLDQVELENYIDNKYGSEADEVSHYVTQKVTADDGTVLLPEGLHVPENYVYYYKPNVDADVTLSSFPVAVTNRQNEWNKNEEKRTIQLINKKYVYDIEREWTNFVRPLSDDESETYIP